MGVLNPANEKHGEKKSINSILLLVKAVNKKNISDMHIELEKFQISFKLLPYLPWFN